MLKKYWPTIVVFFAIILLVEIVSFFLLKSENKSSGLFIKNASERHSRSFNLNEMKGYGFNEIHPLLGWQMSNEIFEEKGYNYENQIIKLETKTLYCDSHLVILITGGSTSDIGLHQDNWPNELIKILNENNKCVKLLVASVGGYNSGQELLKLILHVNNSLKPDVHISYSGANEIFSPHLVSDFEQRFFMKTIEKSKPLFLPNTINFILSKINRMGGGINLSELNFQSPDLFWFNNVSAMNAMAQYYHYNFFAVLQPVINYSGLNIDSAELWGIDYKDFMEEYDVFYPSAQKIADNHSFIVNFTEVFEGVNQNVFLDDCHLKPNFQRVIASEIYTKLLADKI
jgi:hypothetical protein